MSDNDPDYPAMLLAGYMFGGPITSHVSDRIRNREGLELRRERARADPGRGQFGDAIGDRQPESGERPEGRIQLRRRAEADAEGTASRRPEFASSKKAYLETRTSGRAQDAGLLNLIATHELQGRTMKWDADLEAKIQSLTLEQVNAAFRAAYRSRAGIDRQGRRFQSRRRV